MNNSKTIPPNSTSGKKTHFQKAVYVFSKTLKKDEAMFFTYQCTIALAFFDEAKKSKIPVSDKKLMEISDKAAKNFMEELCSK